LIYPVVSAGKVIGFRGRAINCDCPKWLSAAGSKVHLMGKALKTNRPLFVVESPVDMMLILQEMPQVGAVANTAGANTWRDQWSGLVAACLPEVVIVVYDNDLAGAATGAFRAQLEKEWREKHPKALRPPQSGAEMVARKLRAVPTLRGRVNILRWPENAPKGADVMDLIKEVR
jgi:hypothetical protein